MSEKIQKKQVYNQYILHITLKKNETVKRCLVKLIIPPLFSF